MARSDLAKKFNIKSIWEPYIQERAGQAYFEPKTAWPAPTYEYWWPYPFPPPEMPGAPSPVERLGDPEGVARRTQEARQVPSLAPSADIQTLGGGGMDGPIAAGPGGALTGALAGALAQEAAGSAAKGALSILGGKERDTMFPYQEGLEGVPGEMPSPFSLGSSGVPSPIGVPPVGGLGAATPATAATEAASEAMGTAAGSADIYGQAGELLTSGAYAPAAAAGTAGAEAGAMAGSASAAQGAVGPALEATAGWAPVIGQLLSFLPLLWGGTPLTPFSALTGLGDKPKTTAQQAELRRNREKMWFGDLMTQATSLPEATGIFNALGGPPTTSAEISTPSFLQKALGQDLFAGGDQGTLSTYALFDALTRLAPPGAQTGIRDVAQTFNDIPQYGQAPGQDLYVPNPKEGGPDVLLSSLPRHGQFQDVLENVHRLQRAKAENVPIEQLPPGALYMGAGGHDLTPLARIAGVDPAHANALALQYLAAVNRGPSLEGQYDPSAGIPAAFAPQWPFENAVGNVVESPSSRYPGQNIVNYGQM